jgi:eukaryotic-like serine/threonine-protein kinase
MPAPVNPPDNRVEGIFHAALDVADAVEREHFIDAQCTGTPALAARVRRLLAEHESADDLLNRTPIATEIQWEVARLKPEEAGDRIGLYKLLQQIGEGGFGTVWMAEQEQPVRRRVALKVIKLGMDTKEVIARFEQERQALAMMEHPNIARVFDAGATQHGRPFFVMELVRGVRITDYCDEQQLSTRERIDLFITVCQAVQHAHQKGIIHRDLKPSNILVTINDGEAVPKVIDFGVAKATSGRLTEATLFTQFEQMVGTPLYMSPEQAELTSLDIDTRSDIYSLGVLLYELLTGRTPIDTATMARAGMDEIRRIIREVDPPRPSARVKTLDGNELTTAAKRRHTEGAKLPAALRGDLDWIVMRCLEKDRKRRYETASSLALDLKRHLKNEIVTARPPTVTYLAGRLIRRHKLAFAASAAVAATFAIGSTISVWQAVRANHALDELRATAPAFAAQARALASKERFPEAIEKLDYAIKLRPDASDYLLAKADLLQCQLRFADAAAAYRAALRLAPENARAQANAALCDKLQAELLAHPNLSRESVVKLFATMTAERRSAAELLTIGRMVGDEKKLILDYWIERLRDLPIPPELPIEKRLTMAADGNLALDLSRTPISDLTLLADMPLVELNLNGCTAITDFRPLSGLPLQGLSLDGTRIVDLAPLAKMRTLKKLSLRLTGVRDLSPLKGLPIESLDLFECKVTDLAPLQNSPLRTLILHHSTVGELKPLAGLRLEYLDCTGIPATDFSALSGMPLKTLNLQITRIAELSFLRKMPLEELNLHGCLLAHGFQVLAELKSLETLILPEMVWNWPAEEIEAISALRQHPRLRQIQVGIRMNREVSSALAEEFWKNWDADTETVLALRRAGMKFSVVSLNDGGLALTVNDPAFTDLSIFRKARFARLYLDGTNVSDLRPLAGQPLKIISLKRTPVTDLSPLANFALEELTLKETGVTDLSFLRRAPLCDSLERLFLDKLKVTDFSPVAACKALRVLSLYQSAVTDLEPLRGLHLRELYLASTQVKDFSVLAGMPLERLFIDLTPATDLKPLLTLTSLKDVILPEHAENIEELRKLPNLQRVSFHYDARIAGPSMTAAEFWARRTPPVKAP